MGGWRPFGPETAQELETLARGNVMSNLKIGTRLAAVFFALTVLMLLLGGFGLMQASRINDAANELGENWLPSVRALGEVRAAANTARRASLRHVIEWTAQGKEGQHQAFLKAVDDQLKPALLSYSKLVSSPQEQQIHEAISGALNDWLKTEPEIARLSEGGEATFAAARAEATGNSTAKFLAAMAAIERGIEYNAKASEAETAHAHETYSNAVKAIGTMMVISAGLALLLAVLVTRSIVRPLASAVDTAQRVSEGDLTSNFEVSGRDEVADLLRTLGKMNSNLSQLVNQVRNASDSIATGATQIASGNADLSQRTEEQAANLEQTAASLSEMNSSVSNSTDTAARAAALASSASDSARAGGAAVSSVIAVMSDISASSERIADIITVIDGIAFQTNILALNAAVEAARAGEQGRGFAVVAGEVRSLAQRSAEAAKEVRVLIGTSVDQVESGSRLVEDAGGKMASIVSQVASVAQMMGELHTASSEQSQGIGQVNDAMSQLDRVTQQNAALVEQAAAAAESLRNQAGQLTSVVGTFKLEPVRG